jgi:hypothetical protein
MDCHLRESSTSAYGTVLANACVSIELGKNVSGPMFLDNNPATLQIQR